MQIHSLPKSSSLAVRAGPGALHQRARTQGPARRLPVWAAAGLASLVAAFSLVQAGPADSTLTHGLEEFQHRVMADAGPATAGSPASMLARRYLDALQPEMRQRISDQVRGEQRAGVTPPGQDAFVLRRLALYEVALQQSRAVAASRAP